MRYCKKRRKTFQSLYLWIMILISVCMIAGISDGMKRAEEVSNSKNKGLQENEQQFIHELKEENKTEKEKTESDTDAYKDKKIRVLLMSTSYKSIAHPVVTVSAKKGMSISFGDEKKDFEKNEKVEIKPDSTWFQKGNICIKPKKGKVKIHNIERGDGHPSYAGILELRQTSEGIVIINELPVEEYLCGVVPSEMPASFELEALKAQAVCARSYAYKQMKNYAFKEYKAHVNDSTDYQVYNNSQQAERSTQAVKETKGQKVWYKGEIASTYYYSTSCGKTTTTKAWGDKKSKGYLKSVKVEGKDGDYEKELPWYRWEIKISKDQLGKIVSLNVGKQLGEIKKVHITQKGPGDVVCEIEIVGEEDSVKVATENKIRRAFGSKEYEIILNNGSRVEGRELLPSAFFEVKKEGNTFIFSGGGFGHGIGMSQTGANEMAKQGKTYKEILQLFYHNVEIR